VTLEHVIYHAEIVVRATERALVIGDMPFMTFQVSPEQALTNAGRLMQEAGVQAVKLEGGEYMAPTIARLVQNGIPVMAHIGLTPQSVNQFGGFVVRGKDVDSAERLLKDAVAVQEAGAFSLVLELVPAQLAKQITERLRIATIGIGAGPHCSGQVQVFHDILGLYPSFGPRHSKVYAQVGEMIQSAISRYIEDVRADQFPTAENSSTMKEEVLTEILERWARGASR
jgi:3-methyl-2-oxobutanoate hydroxymethyltransferase